MPHSQSRRAGIRSGPRLELLEDRLPPGDILLGIGMTLNSFGSDAAAGTEAVMEHRQFGGLSWDDGDDRANLSILAGDGEPRFVSSRSTVVRLEHSHATVERTTAVAVLMAMRPE